MTYLVNENCIKCKHMDCVEGCPVDCFYEGENMLVINPDECIDCGVCEPECPVDAIIQDFNDTGTKWYDLNFKYSDRFSFSSGLIDSFILKTRSLNSIIKFFYY